MERNDLLTSAEYWTTKVQTDLCALTHLYMRRNRTDTSETAKQLGISEQTFSRVLDCAYDQRLSKLIGLSLAIGYVPVIEFKSISDILSNDNTKDV